VKLRVIIPVKPFAEAKQRLSPALDPGARAKLAEDLFRHVFEMTANFAGPACLVVVSRAQEILDFAAMRGTTALPECEPDLNAALRQAADHVLAQGASKLMVVASDLPLLCPGDLAAMAEHDCAIAPDRRRRGTNALLWPAAPRPPFRFGVDSFSRHRAEARGNGLDPCIVSRTGLAHDVDLPGDLIGIGS
jgi:2-phospho-L-lactate guanylyltransferase